MGGDEDVVSDRGVVPDVVTAPHHHVAAHRDERLNRVVLEDEAVLAELHVAPDEGVAAHVAGQLEPGPLRVRG